ncbi:hypothetical protein BOTNAR_0001g00390 [Botryotinia narcissicola]|uniref:Uncharacterized protein n=1 Tax=Botryotinia narcissicola TaxID=278944 RepID=A0A4Z1JAV2_9HELO|nr:hypothetical protein BOTNAR_0001g00390 [Botryotinia narcissicola]
MQGTTYPTLLRPSQDTDGYHYIGHFVVSSVVTTTDFNQVLEILPDLSLDDKHTKQKLLKERDRALGSISESVNDLPINFYTVQYVFFGKEQYKILVDAKNKDDALKAADHTIDLLIEADNQPDKSFTPSTTVDKASQTGLLSEPHSHDITPPLLKIPTAPRAMRSDHSTIEVQTLSGSVQRDSVRSSFSQVQNLPAEPAAMRGGHLSSESETFSESCHHNSIRSSLSQTIKIPKGPAAMMRVCPSTSDKEAPRQSNPARSSTLSTNSSFVNGASIEPIIEEGSYTSSDKEFSKDSKHHDIVSTPLTRRSFTQGATATLNKRQTPGDKCNNLTTPNRHHAIDSPLPSLRNNHEEST